MEDTRKSTRLLERRKRQVEEEERKARKERKRAKTMFQRKSNVIAPNDMIVDTRTGKINLGPEVAPADVKVKVEPNDSEKGLNALMQHHEEIQEENPTSCPVDHSNENENGTSTSELHIHLNPVSAEKLSLTAVFRQLDEMKKRLKEQDQKIAQLTTKLEAAKDEEKARNYGQEKRIAELELKLSSAKDVQDERVVKKGLIPNNDQAQVAPEGNSEVIALQPSAVSEANLQGNPDQNRSKDMAMLLPKSNDNWKTGADHPDVCVIDCLPEEKSRNERMKAVLNILVEQKRTIAGNINWSSLCGLMKKCRLVCQSWKASVDSVLQTHPSHLQLFKPFKFETINHEDVYPCPLDLSTVEKPLGSRFSIDIAPSKMGQFIMNSPSENAYSNYNPVPTRHLRVLTTGLPNYWRFLVKGDESTGNVYHLTDYLRVFGHQIWYLRLSWEHEIVQRTDFDDLYSNVSEILHLVPNLRLLSLDLHYYIGSVRLSEAEMKYQFPCLKHLVVLECFQENPVIVEILKANIHVRSLAFHQLWYRESTELFKLDLPNLSELFISYADWTKTEIFTKANVTWKIRKLQLQFNCMRTSLSLHSIQSIIDGLAVFGDSLEDLKLGFGNLDFDLEGMQLKLPRLKSLCIQTSNRDKFKWGMFLAELKLLEKLEIVVDVRDLAAVSSFHEEPHWLTMPQLRSVCLVARMYFGYPDFMKEERTGFKLKRVGMPTVKFNYIKVSYLEIKY